MSKDALDQISKARRSIMEAQFDYHKISIIEDEAQRQQAYIDYAHLMDVKLMQLSSELDHAFHWLSADLRRQQQYLQANPKEFVGPVTFSSGKVMVSDPGYNIGTWCQYVLENVKTGTWMTTKTSSDEGQWGIRTASIEAYIDEAPNDNDYELESNADIGVDSGQAGFFELDGYNNTKLFGDKLMPVYPAFEPKPDDDKEQQEIDTFYGICCEITLNRKTGVLPYGIVSDSGYGDGSYDLFVRRDTDGLVTAMKLVFIGEEEEEEEDYDDGYGDEEEE